MSSGMDSSILDTYLYEENNLLDQLDEMLVADEKNGDFSTDDVNEIFRIMHTIKGCTATVERTRSPILISFLKEPAIPVFTIPST